MSTTTVADDLTSIRRKLHDDGAVLWTDAELLRWYKDGYRELLGRTGATRRWRPLDVPGRHTWALTQDWEDAYVTGSVWVPLLAAAPAGRRVTARWEAQHLEGLTPSASLTGLTQSWERAHVTSTDRRHRFTFNRDHHRVVRLMWDDKRLHPISVRELDLLETEWSQQQGTQRAWTDGTGRLRSVEVFEVETDYGQAYHVVDGEAGLPRRFTGSRSYTATVEPTYPENAFAYTTPGDAQAMRMSGRQWISSGFGVLITSPSTSSPEYDGVQAWEPEVVDGATTFSAGSTIGCYVWEHQFGADLMVIPLGSLRRATSPDRQYLPLAGDLAIDPIFAGRMLDIRSSEDSVLALEEVVPLEELTSEDVPVLIPDPMRKYLRYYVWSQAFAHPGEGRDLILADHYAKRFARGVVLLKRFADPTTRDVLLQREDVGPTNGRPPRVRLPSTFPAVS